MRFRADDGAGSAVGRAGGGDPWLRAEHREEIPASRVVGNPAVRSWAACAACHPDAVAGRFDEGRARVPPLASGGGITP